MMKGKKVITYAVSFLVALGCVSAFPVTVKADTGYEVYPNPHSMDLVLRQEKVPVKLRFLY